VRVGADGQDELLIARRTTLLSQQSGTDSAVPTKNAIRPAAIVRMWLSPVRTSSAQIHRDFRMLGSIVLVAIGMQNTAFRFKAGCFRDRMKF
jgi:hypothetical protein